MTELENYGVLKIHQICLEKLACQYFLKISLKNTEILLAKISPYVYLEFLPLAAEAGSRFNFCFKF